MESKKQVGRRVRCAFSAEFKAEAVRMVAERTGQGQGRGQGHR